MSHLRKRLNHKYSREERKIAYEITKINHRLRHLRKNYLDLDIKKQNLVWQLNGKYKNESLQSND